MKTEHRLSLVAGFALLVAAPAAAQGKVWVVDDSGGPGVAFLSVQAAVDAAAEGDTVLVKDGFYDETVTISGKSLAVIGEAGASVQVQRSMHVLGLGSSQWSLVRGIDAPMTGTVVFGEALRVGGNTGPFWVEDGSFDGNHNFGGAASGVLVSGAAAATIVRCQLRGGTGIASKIGTSKQGGPGLWAISTSAHVYESTLLGEDGSQTGPFFFGLPAGGGSGATIDGSFLFTSGSDLIGGQGADGLTSGPSCIGGGLGGNGLTVYGASSQALLLDTSLQPGAGGLGSGACSPGLPGQPTFLFAGSASTLPGSARALAVDSPVREGQPVSAVATGLPGELVFLGLASTQSLPLLVPPWNGALHLGPGISVHFMGIVPPSGTLALGATAPALAPGVESAIGYLQPGFVSPTTGAITLGAPSALVVLDSAF